MDDKQKKELWAALSEVSLDRAEVAREQLTEQAAIVREFRPIAEEIRRATFTGRSYVQIKVNGVKAWADIQTYIESLGYHVTVEERPATCGCGRCKMVPTKTATIVWGDRYPLKAAGPPDEPATSAEGH